MFDIRHYFSNNFLAEHLIIVHAVLSIPWVI